LPLPTEAITLAVGWYLRFGVASRDLEEPLTKCEVEVEDRTSSRRRSRWCRCRPTLPAMAPPHGDRWPVTSPR
jgi:transposase-like protein